MQLISKSEGKKLKKKSMENLHTMFELYWPQKLQQAETDHIEIPSWMKTTSQLEKEHPDPCDKEPEKRSDIFFQKLANDDIKNKTQRI